MQSIRIVLVNDNPRMCDSLAELFGADKRFEVCAKAYSAGEAMEYFRKQKQPDVALIDMLMPMCDGTGLVMKLREEKLCSGTMLIGLTGFLSDVAMRMIQSLGLAYVIAMPSKPDAIYKRVCALLQLDFEDENVPLYMDIRSKQMRERDEIITRYLFAMGVCAHHDGFKYMRDAVALYLDSRNRSLGITTGIYPEIARRYGISEKIVERSIRYAIEMAWLRGNVENQYRLFGYTVKEDKGRPTNKECITLIAERTKIRIASNY
ncbi:MAG TPA: sporulation initiation factor Spo0A C-terminal domain-containing protein [Clostridia bacterium]|nr:sporulation initiation factor Spo0A C-terminal domain-containing protein [Clostridia bacterium]